MSRNLASTRLGAADPFVVVVAMRPVRCSADTCPWTSVACPVVSARQLDATLWERLLCELHCTRAGLGQLTQDLDAIFGLFDTPSADGARLFRLSGDVLKVLVSRRTF